VPDQPQHQGFYFKSFLTHSLYLSASMASVEFSKLGGFPVSPLMILAPLQVGHVDALVHPKELWSIPVPKHIGHF
jgi:hypothetical protein